MCLVEGAAGQLNEGWNMKVCVSATGREDSGVKEVDDCKSMALSEIYLPRFLHNSLNWARYQ